MHDLESVTSETTTQVRADGGMAYSHPHQTWMLSGAVAKRLGVKTSTLKKWRYLGKGPAEWKRISATVVVYSVRSVLEFERSWVGPAAEQTN